MMSLSKTALFALFTSLVAACAGTTTEDTSADSQGEEDLTEAPYLEVVKTDGPQGTKIVAHGLPAVARNADPLGSTELAALLLETPSSTNGYVSYSFDERWGMGSFTGSESPLLSIDTKTSPPTVTVHQNFVDMANARLKEQRWSRFVEHTATNNAVETGYGWKVTYEPTAASYPKLHVERNGTNVLTKGAGYFGDNAFGPSGCTYVPELATAAISTQHKALLMRVHFAAKTEKCAITDRYFTEELP